MLLLISSWVKVSRRRRRKKCCYIMQKRAQSGCQLLWAILWMLPPSASYRSGPGPGQLAAVPRPTNFSVRCSQHCRGNERLGDQAVMALIHYGRESKHVSGAMIHTDHKQIIRQVVTIRQFCLYIVIFLSGTIIKLWSEQFKSLAPVTESGVASEVPRAALSL